MALTADHGPRTTDFLGRFRRTGCLGRVPFLVAAWLLVSTAASAQLLARVETGWSPFLTVPVLKGTPGEDLIAEARRLLGTDPGRVAQVLGRAKMGEGAPTRIVEGLRADALYALGGKGLLEAQKLYRAVITSDPTVQEEAWAGFMLGNIHKVHGFIREAEVSYRSALRLGDGPWRCAALFDIGVLELETGRVADARAALESWLQEFGSAPDPAKALVLQLLAESLATLGDREAALARWAEGRRLDRDAWIVRPEVGHVLAQLYRSGGSLRDAVRILEAIPIAYPGSPEGARARLAVGEMWEAAGSPSLAVRSYAQLLEEGAGPEEAQTARLRIALLGAEHGNRVPLTEHYEAYRIYFRPKPVLEEVAAGNDALSAQRALRGLGLVARAEGRTLEALRLFARVFQQYPRSPESGRAYDAFTDAFEAYLAEQSRAGEHLEVITTHDSMKDALDWVATRDRGKIEARVAEAYEALGAPRLAREVYERLQQRGTRAFSAADLEERILGARAREGDMDALRVWTARHPGDPKAELKMARKLKAQGRLGDARDRYVKAADLAAEPAAKMGSLAEADRLLDAQGRVGDLLAGLAQRQSLRRTLPAGAERDAWERSAALSEARLRFARGDYSGASRTFDRIPELGAEDTYLLALAEKRAGRRSRANELFVQLSKSGDAVIASLAGFHLEVATAEAASRKGL